MPDQQLEQIIQRGIAQGMSDDDIRLVAQEYQRRKAAEPGAQALKQSAEDPLGYTGAFLSNIPASAGRALRDTGAGLLGLAKQIGAYPIQSLNPERESTDLGNTLRNIVPGVLANVQERWGSPEARALNIRDDPFGMALDGAGAVSAASGVRQAAGKVAKTAGKGAYRAGVALGNPTIKREIGSARLAARGFEDEIPLTHKGADKASELGRASADNADALVAQYAASHPAAPRGRSNPGRAPGYVALPDAIADVRPLYDKVGDTALGTNDPARGQLQKLSKKMAEGHEWPKALPDAQRLKRREQEMAHSIFRAEDRGTHIPAPTQTRAQFGKSVATSTQREIERQVPDVAPINARTQELLLLERLANRANEASHIVPRLLSAGGIGAALGPAGIPQAAAAAGTSFLMSTPGGLSRLGLLLKKADMAPVMSTPSRLTLIGDLAARLRPEDEER